MFHRFTCSGTPANVTYFRMGTSLQKTCVKCLCLFRNMSRVVRRAIIHLKDANPECLTYRYHSFQLRTTVLSMFSTLTKKSRTLLCACLVLFYRIYFPCPLTSSSNTGIKRLVMARPAKSQFLHKRQTEILVIFRHFSRYYKAPTSVHLRMQFCVMIISMSIYLGNKADKIREILVLTPVLAGALVIRTLI